ncbi:MAG TPA: C4-type zinc ribbon domain-containing protein [Acidimicrobiales bacterium]|nr:C4-type zinc ribbon domain-containing protein [Acidimicrobiales bacterium]
MSGALDQLLVVQDLDTTITQLQHKRVALPERSGLTGLEVELAGYAAEKVALMGRRAELMATQKDLEGQIAVVTERRTGIEQRMYAARGSSTRDLQAMDEEVRHLTQRQNQLEELELVAMVDQEPIDAELAQVSQRSTPIGERVAVLRAEVEAGQAEIDQELAQAIPARVSAAAELPPALADRYEKLRTRMRGVAVARLIGHRCDGCHQELSAVEVDRIRAMPTDTVVTCDLCGRILVPV